MPSTVLPFPLRSVDTLPRPAPGSPPVLVLSTDGVVVGCNTVVSDLIGRAAADLVGARAEQVASGTADALAAAAQGQEAGRSNVHVVGHDRRRSHLLPNWSVVHTVDATVHVVFTADSGASPTVGTGPGGDELLSAIVARSRAIADTAEEGIWELSPDGTTRYANARMAALLGLPPEPFDVGVLDQPAPHAAAELRTHLTSRLGQDPERYELAYAHPDQRERRLWVSSSTLRDDEGAALALLAMVSDVTDTRRAQEQLRTSSLHDGLTGLPNRTLLLDRLQHAVERSVARRRSCSSTSTGSGSSTTRGATAPATHCSSPSRHVWSTSPDLRHGRARRRRRVRGPLSRTSTPPARRSSRRRSSARWASRSTSTAPRCASAPASAWPPPARRPRRRPTCCATPTRPCTRPRPPAAGGSALFDRALAEDVEHRYALAADLRTALADDTLTLHYQPVVDSTPATSSGWRRWRAGRTPNGVRCRRPASSPSPSSPAWPARSTVGGPAGPARRRRAAGRASRPAGRVRRGQPLRAQPRRRLARPRPRGLDGRGRPAARAGAARDHRDLDHAGHRARDRSAARPARARASASPSTTSAPATARWPTCATCPSRRSRSTGASSPTSPPAPTRWRSSRPSSTWPAPSASR